MIFESILVIMMLLLATEINSEISHKTACRTSCGGDLNIPFPFGTTSDCPLDATFFITCNHSYNPKSPTKLFYIVSGLLVPAFVSSWIFRRHRKEKVVKLRQYFFRRNGGLILENMLSVQRTLQFFTAADLKRATNNYDENKILGRELHFGITYEGILPNQVNRTVTIKRFDAIDECNPEVFIRNLVTLSQINHRNIVKLIGCCLETRVPLLVYEFISAKTLHDYIHDDDLVSSLTWDVRLKIAAETAGALAYMHFAAAEGPVIHGHLTFSSILLHHDYTVKVDGFALAHLENCIHGGYIDEIGYMDPEYLLSGQVTVKSDVYGFGVVLAELLTGKIVDTADFVSLTRGDDLLKILDHRLGAESKIVQLTEVAELAQKCLSSSSEDRPTMEEVAMALNIRGGQGRVPPLRVPEGSGINF